MMTKPDSVLITGATGRIGGAVAQRWSAFGLGRMGEVRVRALVRDPRAPAARKLAGQGIALVQGDLTNPLCLGGALDGVGLVVHAGAETGLTSPMKIWETNVEATRALFEAATAAGVTRFVFLSSLAVYGACNSIVEDDQPLNACGEFRADAKLAAELCLRELAALPGSPQLTILRLPAVYGPGMKHWTEQPAQLARRGALSVVGAGDAAFRYGYIENVIDAVTAAATAEATGTYNIFDGVTTQADFLGRYAAMAKKRLRRQPVRVAHAWLGLREWLGWLIGVYPLANRRALDALLQSGAQPDRAEKAAAALNWHPRFSLDEGMAVIRQVYFPQKKADPRTTRDDWQENPEWSQKGNPAD